MISFILLFFESGLRIQDLEMHGCCIVDVLRIVGFGSFIRMKTQ